jgi:hypothetical protein
VTTVSKGDRVAAEWFDASPLGTHSLTGAQMKVTARRTRVTGIVRHVRGDRPEMPTQIMVFIDHEGEWAGPLMRPPGCTCERMHVGVLLQRIVEVLPKDG